MGCLPMAFFSFRCLFQSFMTLSRSSGRPPVFDFPTPPPISVAYRYHGVATCDHLTYRTAGPLSTSFFFQKMELYEKASQPYGSTSPCRAACGRRRAPPDLLSTLRVQNLGAVSSSLYYRGQSQVVRICSKAGNLTHTNPRDDRFVAKLLASVNVGQVNLDRRYSC
jgi:hypothetical protein